MTYDASNRKDIRRAEKTARLAERDRIDYTKRIMSDTAGRQWMHSHLLRCNIFSTPFVRGSNDATAFNCGAQNLGLQIFADVAGHCPTQYVLMMQEASQKDPPDDRHDSDNRSTPGEHDGSPPSGRDAEGPVPGEYDPLSGAGEEA